MQFKVPQNVQIEDKILPFMTLRQLIISGVGGGFAYSFYLGLQHQSPEIWIPPVVIISLLTIAIAFMRINGVPFVQWLLLLVERYLNESKRLWVKSADDVGLFEPPAGKTNLEKTKKAAPKSTENLKKLDSISHVLDTGGLGGVDDTPDPIKVKTTTT